MPETGPNRMARAWQARIDELQAIRDDLPRSLRKPVNRELHEARQMLDWCKSRAGYVATPEDLGLL